MKKGIDVSVHNGQVDWARVKKDGIAFAILRASYGDGSSSFINSGVDVTFERNYRKAKKEGLDLGAYHYLYARNMEECKRELEFFLARISGKTFDYPVVLDMEDSEAQGNLSKEFRTDMAVYFLDGLEKAGYYASLYSSKYWLENLFDEERLKAYDKWLAEWSSVRTYKGKAGLWQYSSQGKVDGINGNVDMNYAIKDYPSIMKNYGLNGYEKKEEEKEISFVVYGKEADKTAAELLSKRLSLSLAFVKSQDELKLFKNFYYIGKADSKTDGMTEIYGQDRLDTLKKVIKLIEEKNK